MPVHERRQHFRIEDYIHFAYKILQPGECYHDHLKPNDFFEKTEQHHIELLHYLSALDREIIECTQVIAAKDRAVAHYLNLLNSKIDYVVRHFTMDDKTPLCKVNLSLGGISFKTREHIPNNSFMKLLIYTKPSMIPLIVNAVSFYCKRQGVGIYRTAARFSDLTAEQEKLLSEHIMVAQTPCQAD